jgi:TM2 domain-containing membrane protein YozV
MAPGAPVYAVGKSPLAAVLLSFLIPGVGQFYCGEVKKGAIMLGIYLVSWLTTLIVIGFVGVIGVWIWSMFDAYSIAKGTTALSR